MPEKRRDEIHMDAPAGGGGWGFFGAGQHDSYALLHPSRPADEQSPVGRAKVTGSRNGHSSTKQRGNRATRAGGQKVTAVSPIGFKQLWDNYPSDPPCTNEAGEPNFSDQCAIKLSVCLQRAGVDLSSVPKKQRCWSHSNSVHVLAAEQMASWLQDHRFRGCAVARDITGGDFDDTIDGKTGIIFFKDYWQREKETGKQRTGDHIDLWNGSRLTTLSSWLRIQWGLSWDGLWSDFSRAKQILFWEVL